MSALLSKLSPRGKTPNGEGFGGTPEITPEDVAAALAMPSPRGSLTRIAYEWGLAKWAFDRNAVRTVKRECIRRMLEANTANNWGKSESWVAALAVHLLEQQLIPPVCSACNGSGSVAAKTCEVCLGCGRRPISKRRAARALAVSESAWRRTWEPRTLDLVRDMTDWETQVQAHLGFHFRGEM